jgi:hypothetical protein
MCASCSSVSRIYGDASWVDDQSPQKAESLAGDQEGGDNVTGPYLMRGRSTERGKKTSSEGAGISRLILLAMWTSRAESRRGSMAELPSDCMHGVVCGFSIPGRRV